MILAYLENSSSDLSLWPQFWIKFAYSDISIAKPAYSHPTSSVFPEALVEYWEALHIHISHTCPDIFRSLLIYRNLRKEIWGFFSFYAMKQIQKSLLFCAMGQIICQDFNIGFLSHWKGRADHSYTVNHSWRQSITYSLHSWKHKTQFHYVL